MKAGSLVVGVVLITAAALLPIVGWRISVKASHDDHFETDSEKLADAAAAGQVAKMNALLNSGVRVNAGSEGGMAPLFAAVCAGETAAIKVLLSHGADISVRYKSSPTESQRIARSKYKGSWNVSDGDTPLLASVRTGNCDVAKLLVANGADVKAVNAVNSTAVSLAMQATTKVDLLTLLIQHGASVKVTDSNGDTPLMWLCQRNDEPLARATIKAGCDINNMNVFRETALLQTVRTNALPNIELILARTASDVNLVDSKGNCPLSYAVTYNRPELVKALLDRGASTKQADHNGSTPLISAALLGNTRIVGILVAAQADTRIKDKNGMTALDWAKSRQNKEIESILQKAARTGK